MDTSKVKLYEATRAIRSISIGTITLAIVIALAITHFMGTSFFEVFSMTLLAGVLYDIVFAEKLARKILG